MEKTLHPGNFYEVIFSVLGQDAALSDLKQSKNVGKLN